MTDRPPPPEYFHDLVGALVALSPYRKHLAPMVDEVARVALICDQVRGGLERVAERSRFASTRRVSKSDLGEDRTALLMFLEHIRFACPAFLASVGEAPQEAARV